MANLLALLGNSAASLGAQTAFSATVSNNLSNANTPGYARQRAEIAATLPGEYVGGSYLGQGARLQAITQARDSFLEAQLPSAFGRAAASNAEASALQSVTALDPDSGLSNSISSFYSSLRALSQKPSDPGLREAVVSNARAMAFSFNRTAQSLADARSGLDNKLNTTLPEVNSLASQVASFNKQIKIARNAGGQPNDLLDARQKAMDRLSALTGAVAVPTGEGDVNMVLSTGTALVSGDRAATFSAVADPANGGHLAVQLSPAGSSVAGAVVGLGGELSGYISARDGALKTAEGRVDALAAGLSTAINTAHSAGYGADGVNGRNLFDTGATVAGAASRMSVDPSILADSTKLAVAANATAATGDNGNLLKVLGTETQTLSTGMNAAGSLSSAVSEFGSAAERIASVSLQDTAVLGNLQTMRQSVSGVSIDEEMVNLTRAQRAFEAISKVIQTTDEMLDTLMKLK